MKDGVPNVILSNGYVCDTPYQNQSRGSSSLEVLVTHLPPVIEIRPQGEGKGNQASMLVPITRLKPRALDLTWRKTKPTTPLGVGVRLTQSNNHNSIKPFLSKNSENCGVGGRAHDQKTLRFKGLLKIMDVRCVISFLYLSSINTYLSSPENLSFPGRSQVARGCSLAAPLIP